MLHDWKHFEHKIQREIYSSTYLNLLANLSSALSILHISYNTISGINEYIFFHIYHLLLYYCNIEIKSVASPCSFPPLHVQTSNISDSIIPVSGTDRKVGLGQGQETETGIVASGYSVTTF